MRPVVGDPHPFESFSLPRVPGVLGAWLLGLVSAHYTRTQRCMAVMLLLDVQSHDWGWCIPRQRCQADAASWRMDNAGDLGVRETQRLAGVFQSINLDDPAQVPECVPPVTGVHLLGHFWQGRTGVWGFVRLDEQTLVPVPADELTSDEVAQTLGLHAERLRVV